MYIYDKVGEYCMAAFVIALCFSGCSLLLSCCYWCVMKIVASV